MTVVKDIVLGLAQPVVDLVDDLTTTDEERLRIKQQLFELQVKLYEQVLEFETRLAEAQSRIVAAEAASESWLTANWRPLMMVTFGALIVDRWLGISTSLGIGYEIPPEVEIELWSVIKLGLSGYVAGRSIEKVAPAVVDALGKLKGKD